MFLMEQVENFEEYSVTEGIGSEATTSGKIYEYEPGIIGIDWK